MSKQPFRALTPRIGWAGFIGGLAVGCGVFLTATSGWLIVQASTHPVILTLLTAVVGVRAFGMGRPAFRYAERVISHDAALDTLRQRRTQTYRALIPLTPARLGRRRRADLLTGVVRDLDDEVDLQVRTAVPLVATAVATTAVIFVAFLINVTAAVVLIVFAAVAILVGALDHALERRGQADALEARSRMQRAAHLVAANAGELRAIGAADECLRWVDEAQRDLQDATRRQARGRAIGMGLSLVFTGVATVVLAYLLFDPLRRGEIDAPVTAMLVFMPLALGDVLGLIPDAVGALARGRAAQRRLHALLDQTPAVADNAHDCASGLAPRLELRGVSASWTGDDEHLTPTELVVEPGEHITIVGDNGTGKSTLLAVLARHLDPASGSYLVGGRDVRSLSADSVRELFAVVDDDPHLFVGTVRANLLLARPDADDHDIAAALVQAGLGRWLAGLPDGLDTDLGDGNRGVSGGERARLGIARAVLSRRPIVLLDEPVAHLDTPTARAVLDDLHAATAGSTVLLVAHQAVGTAGAHRIVKSSQARSFEPALSGRTP
ncbi:thiol reductant ABC exporter subunit CydC [Yimella sp. cx-51]|uniref:thiol reductant ABC exporter subunit CydC n=1 Tax=Yimella sp. cx-51 TaxID=2770551 RepID=UPI00165EBB3C|nr:thiol reductant ABC exporter subunit CydC [Yimella sp. cx-51]MBC9957898.1 thiol reductant ABC exporter subunit CydC [Yimella sp. cx-51]QTH38033.1 thiol reductant ABC exporter subunit CydC [Yimella sp. cx-51]